MNHYQGNSLKQKQENKPDKERLAPVVNSKATVKKKSELLKIAELFLPDDVHDIGGRIVKDYLVPTIRNTAIDIVTYILGGEPTSTAKKSSSSKASYMYHYENKSKNNTHTPAKSDRAEDILFKTRKDANDVLFAMQDALRRYGVVSVGDMYDLADISNENWTIHHYGWTDLSSASVIHTRDGFLLKLPKAMPIE